MKDQITNFQYILAFLWDDYVILGKLSRWVCLMHGVMVVGFNFLGEEVSLSVLFLKISCEFKHKKWQHIIFICIFMWICLFSLNFKIYPHDILYVIFLAWWSLRLRDCVFKHWCNDSRNMKITVQLYLFVPTSFMKNAWHCYLYASWYKS
jgi:hypothetical protein